MPSHILIFFVIIPIIIAVFVYVFAGLKSARLIAVIAQSAFLVMALFMLIASRTNEITISVGGYEGFLGIILRADNLAAIFIFLTVFIFLGLVIYNLRSEYNHTDRLYWFLLFILEGTLIGLFLTRDFFNIFVLMEVSTVVVVILLMHDRKRRNLFAGMTFIMVNIVVMQFYLFGLGYLYMVTGVMDMEAAAYVIAHMDTTELALPYALIMTSIAAKCSLLPLLTWLPKVNALTGSRFTIAALMSGLHIKSGVYLFIRFQDVFGGMASEFFLCIGIITAIAGIILALSQKDIRLLLAYSTVAQVGLIIAGLSLNDEYSRIGSVYHVVNHGLIKVALFLGAGMISYLYKTKDITKIRGLLRVSKPVAIANILAVLGITGATFFGSSISKYFMISGVTGALEWVFIFINFGTILVFVRYSAIFFGRPKGAVLAPDWCRESVVLCLGISCFALGVQPAINFLLNQQVELSFWGYLEKNIVFVISVVAAYLVYKFILVKRDFLRPLRRFDLSFKTMCVSIGAFFGVLLVVLKVG
ncbi:MAG: hypothetical protein FWE11_02520 [Defluviitaleaceae bacterium]|nr:hypothetical protein [Defluviitaleaceae bacterium]